MKTLKRILALLTALVLCLAPMALMVGAADQIAVPAATGCGTCGSNTFITTYIDEYYHHDEIVGSATVCYNEKWCHAVSTCVGCPATYDVCYTKYSRTHASLMPHPANGRYYCSKCGYMAND